MTQQPRDLADWSALGGIVGQRTNSYWGSACRLGARSVAQLELKHFGAALASFGSVAMVHVPGVTPEAPMAADAFGAPPPSAELIAASDVAAVYDGYSARGDKADVVVSSAPQLSLIELRQVAELLDGRCVHPEVYRVPPMTRSALRCADLDPAQNGDAELYVDPGELVGVRESLAFRGPAQRLNAASRSRSASASTWVPFVAVSPSPIEGGAAVHFDQIIDERDFSVLIDHDVADSSKRVA